MLQNVIYVYVSFLCWCDATVHECTMLTKLSPSPSHAYMISVWLCSYFTYSLWITALTGYRDTTGLTHTDGQAKILFDSLTFTGNNSAITGRTSRPINCAVSRLASFTCRSLQCTSLHALMPGTNTVFFCYLFACLIKKRLKCVGQVILQELS